MGQRKLHIACYDVSRPSRLRAALEVTRRYATGGQKSVHECWVTATERADLLQMLCFVIDESEDRVLMVRLDPRRRTVTLGVAVSPVDDDCIVLGAA
jgi:CRISPR-associated protein Cas2